MIIDFLRVLLLLYFVNFVPPFLNLQLDRTFAAPLDGGRLWRDGRPLFGPHKTVRGVLGATFGGGLCGWLLGIGLWLGLAAGVLSMAGDLASSFLKRRRGLASGSDVAGLDQVFEGALPLTILVPGLGLSWWSYPLLLALFCLGAWLGSWFYKSQLLREPFEGYPRPLKARTRLKEFARCQTSSRLARTFFNFEEAFYYHFLIVNAFRVTGLLERGRRNALDVSVRELTVEFDDLPAAFDGFTVLFLSDLHLDGMDGLTERVAALVKDREVDLCLFGGDYRWGVSGPVDEALRRLGEVKRAIAAREGHFAVLGNHDCLQMVGPIEDMGVAVLLNGNHPLERSGQRFWLAGIDDPHYFECHCVDTAFEGVGPGEFCLFLAHTPEAYREAAARGARLYLCGHTHAGQIQLPKVGPVFTHSRAPRALAEGFWREGEMIGYTSSGVGVSGAPVRFRSRGEIVHLTLRRSAGPEPA